LFSVSDNLLQHLDVICTVIQHILHVSKQLFFIC
jgi:membrane-anchored protein YejM (alkaline phosphatase superfamily)